MKIAVYAGSFDPIHFGHLDIIGRAAQKYDKLIVAVGMNSSKKNLFTQEERIGLINPILNGLNKDGALNIQVMRLPDNQLLADFAFEQGAGWIVKGVRNAQDFDYERMLNDINLSQQRGIETEILYAGDKTKHISSSVVKELAKYSGDLHQYVPLNVKQALELRLKGQFIIGVTGSIGSGKSYLCRKILENNLAKDLVGKLPAFDVYNLELDNIAKSIYERTEPVYTELKRQIVREFKMREFSTKELGKIVFEDRDKLQRLNELMRLPMLTRLRAELVYKSGVILLNAALLIEFDLQYLCNNNVIIVSCDAETRRERLIQRGISAEDAVKRMNFQMDLDERLKYLNRSIAMDCWGHYEIFMNDKEVTDEKISNILREFEPVPFKALDKQ